MDGMILKPLVYPAAGLALGLLVVLIFAPRIPLTYNLRNLVVRWIATLLTMLAFTAVVGLMTVMLSVVNGMYALAKGSSVPGNVVVIADGSIDEAFSDLGHDDIDLLAHKDYVRHVTLPGLDGKPRETPLLSWELYQVVNQELENPRPGERARRFVQTRGVEDPLVSGMVHELTLKSGQWFDSGAGVQAVPGGGSEQFVQAVLGEGIARAMGLDSGKTTLAVGDTFTLGPRRWVVAGILNSAGKTFDSEVWAKRKVVGEMLRKDTRSTAVFRVAEGRDSLEVADFATKEFKSPAIQAKTEAAYFDQLNSTNQTFVIAIMIVAVLMAVGGVFGVMNTMFAAVAQRTREIGVLRILGFARWQILVSFFLEAVFLAVLGGALGCAIGLVFNGNSTTFAMTGKAVMLKLVVGPGILLSAMSFSFLMGCVGGLLPALSAIRLKVLDSLR